MSGPRPGLPNPTRFLVESMEDSKSEGAAILAIGDVHLGMTCSGVPKEISSLGIDPEELSPAAGLGIAVEFAIKREVDAVLFAGDVVENTNARFEAILPLEQNVRRLLDARIAVIAVAGNHDVEALPRLAALVDGFTLLGADGQWEAREITKNGRPIAEVVGWSFGEKFVRQSPVAELLAQPLDPVSPSVPRIGLLHADLNASGGNYAPIRQSELDNTGYDAWFLGHIHKPSLQSSNGAADVSRTGYLGSLVGLDPTETGRHGPWLIELPRDREVHCRHLPLSPLRWEHLSVSVEGLEHVEDVPDRILSEAEKFVHRLSDEDETPRALGLRIQLTGANKNYEEIRRQISGEKWNSLLRRVDDTGVFVNLITDAMDLYVDLVEVAAGDDPAALMARRVLTLQRDDQQSRELLEAVRSHLSETAEDDLWSPLKDHRSASDPLSDAALRELLLQAGRAALSSMLSEKADRSGR